MEYKKILKKSWEITKKNKILWLFGLFLGGGANFNFNLGTGSDYDLGSSDIDSKVGNWLSDNWYILAIIIALFLLVFLFFFLISFIFRGGFYKGVELAEQNKKLHFKELWSFGWHNFWRLLGLTILSGLLATGAVIALLIPGILLMLIPVIGWVLGILFIFAGILLIIVVAFVISVIWNYANCYLLLEKRKITESILEGWKLFKANLSDSIVISFLVILITMGLGVGMLIATLILALPFVALGLAAYALMGWVGAGVIALLGILVLLILMFVLRAGLNTYTGSVWVLAWKELKEKKK